MTSIGLTMIVKNEASVIGRALSSVRPLIDYVLVADTGSTDDTEPVIRRWCATEGVPGDVMRRPWVDFAHNRNEALDALRAVPGIDYALTIDADEYLVYDDGFDPVAFRRGIEAADGWNIVTQIESFQYSRTQLFSMRAPFRFRYKLHEYLVPPAGARLTRARGLHNHPTQDGARSRNPNKYLDDALVLERELHKLGAADEAERQRYTYYLGESYRHAGWFDLARNAYLQCAQMGGPSEQVGFSYHNAGLCMETLGEPAAALAAYLKAHEVSPHRAEPLCAAARLANISRRYEEAYRLARLALGKQQPEIYLVDTSCYSWRALDELLVAAIGSHRAGEAVELAERLLSEGRFSPSERARIETNAAIALAQYDLASFASPASSVAPPAS